MDHEIPLDQLPIEGIGDTTKLPSVEIPVDMEVSKSFKVGDTVEITLAGKVTEKILKEGKDRSFKIDIEKVSVLVDEDEFSKLMD